MKLLHFFVAEAAYINYLIKEKCYIPDLPHGPHSNQIFDSYDNEECEKELIKRVTSFYLL